MESGKEKSGEDRLKMNEVPAGMYIHSNSKLNRTMPELKLLFFVQWIFSVLLSNSVFSWGLLLLMVCIGIRLSGMKGGQVCRGVIQLRWFFVMIFVMNALFFRPPESAQSMLPLFSYGIIRIYLPGVIQGIRVVFRTAMVLAGASLYTSSTPPVSIIKSLQWFLLLLCRFRVPVRHIAVIFSAAIQFIPTLYEETDRVKRAQIARGARLEQRGLIARARGVLPVVLPVFVLSFQRADELALALESRGYAVTDNDTREHGVRFRAGEKLAALSGFALVALVVLWDYVL